jgi:hypothetical protein
MLFTEKRGATRSVVVSTHPRHGEWHLHEYESKAIPVGQSQNLRKDDRRRVLGCKGTPLGVGGFQTSTLLRLT